MKKYFVCLMICSAIFSNCKDSKREKLLDSVKFWQGKEILFPDTLAFLKYAKDTVSYIVPESKYKILLYVDSTGCTACKLKLYKWKKLIDEIDSVSPNTVSFLFFFHPKDVRELSYLLQRDSITQPICVDENNILQKLNQFPNNIMFHCFLLNENNKVLCVGNPIYNRKIRELYLSQIKEIQKEKKEVLQTKVHLLTDRLMDVGILKLGEVKNIIVRLKNIGDNSLCVYDVKTSCGCTEVQVGKKTVSLNQEVELQVRYEAEEIGFFNKTIKIECNTENSPIVLKIKGIVKE